MNKLSLTHLIKSYIQEITTSESFDRPLQGLSVLDGGYTYIVFDDSISAKFIFTKRSDIENLPKLIDANNINKWYDISWDWVNTPIALQTPTNWVKVTSTMYKVIHEFKKSKTPNLISFSNNSEYTRKIYFNSEFIKKLKYAFLTHDDIIVNEENSAIYIVDKLKSNLNNETYRKNARNLNISYVESREQYILEQKHGIKKGITRYNYIKDKLQELIINLYIYS